MDNADYRLFVGTASARIYQVNLFDKVLRFSADGNYANYLWLVVHYIVVVRQSRSMGEKHVVASN
jgi:hypothetical protein